MGCTLEHNQPPSDQKIRSKLIKKIKKKSNFTCTLEHNQPPSNQKIRSKPIKKIKKKSNFTCTLEHNQPPSDQKIRSKPIKKIKFHLYTRAQSTPIRSKNPIKTDQKNQISPVH